METQRVFDPLGMLVGMVLFISICVMAYVATTIFITPAYPQAGPLIKNGSCPGSYASSARYCTPMAGAPVCVPKVGTCPGNTVTSGNYCCQPR